MKCLNKPGFILSLAVSVKCLLYNVYVCMGVFEIRLGRCCRKALVNTDVNYLMCVADFLLHQLDFVFHLLICKAKSDIVMKHVFREICVWCLKLFEHLNWGHSKGCIVEIFSIFILN